MKHFTLLYILFFALSTNAQKNTNKVEQDTLKSFFEVGIAGQWQKGNLEQIGIMPHLRAKLSNNSFDLQTSASYNYLLLGKINPVNDFWTNILYQHKPQQLFFTSIHSINGFARSYRIDGSYFSGIGGGINLLNNKSASYFQVHLYTGYLYFKFIGEQAHKSVSLGSTTRALLLLNKTNTLLWELSSYHSGTDSEFWGGGNLLKLDVNVSGHFFLSLMHQLYYHNKYVPNTVKYTSIMQFGISYK